jgi:hypothetical protein
VVVHFREDLVVDFLGSAVISGRGICLCSHDGCSMEPDRKWSGTMMWDTMASQTLPPEKRQDRADQRNTHAVIGEIFMAGRRFRGRWWKSPVCCHQAGRFKRF